MNTQINSTAPSVGSSALFGSWLPAKDAPKRTTLIVGDAGKTGAGYHNGRGQWFIYGTSLPMETPTHWMPFPFPPNASGHTSQPPK